MADKLAAQLKERGVTDAGAGGKESAYRKLVLNT